MSFKPYDREIRCVIIIGLVVVFGNDTMSMHIGGRR